MKATTTMLEHQISWINQFVKKPFTNATEWKEYEEIATSIGQKLRSDDLSESEKIQLKNAYGPAMTAQTLQGHVLEKPHGYAGDYEIIDKFYTHYKSPDEKLAKWDEYLHNFKAVKAVKNRKIYIKQILTEKISRHTSSKSFDVLDLASGPARDLAEFFNETPNADLLVDCVDLDQNAIEYATKLLGANAVNVNFLNKNILRFNTGKKYDLVWSAGLFDYFNDKVFKKLLGRFLTNVKPGGELIIGNFCSSNPDINYMELLDWKLYHRSSADLIKLAMSCGVDRSRISVDMEPEGVNLFIRIKG